MIFSFLLASFLTSQTRKKSLKVGRVRGRKMEFSKSEKKKTPFSQKRFSASFCFSSLEPHSTLHFPKVDRKKKIDYAKK